jgi:hypothetical protein
MFCTTFVSHLRDAFTYLISLVLTKFLLQRKKF